ncbi:MAG: YHYH domain-containing protein [Rhodospirillaceae bacterium]|nr:YHYH domain-containing protein [Rhodospirillaceae bacterium]
MRLKYLTLLSFLLLAVPLAGAFAHSGGTNAAGCHTNHRTGGYHCHNKKPIPQERTTYCHVVRGEYRCGYAWSTCNSLVEKFGGSCTRK